MHDAVPLWGFSISTPSSSSDGIWMQELAMLEYELLHFRPSQLASAATLLAQLYMNDTPR